MKDLHASVSGVAHQPVADVYAFLADFNGYPSWYPSGVKSAEMTGEDTGHTVLALNQGPIQRDFEINGGAFGKVVRTAIPVGGAGQLAHFDPGVDIDRGHPLEIVERHPQHFPPDFQRSFLGHDMGRIFGGERKNCYRLRHTRPFCFSDRSVPGNMSGSLAVEL